MFHQGDRRFRAWLTAFASAEPRSPKRLHDEVLRLNALLAERDREIETLHRELVELRQTLARTAFERTELANDRRELFRYVATLESDRKNRLEQLASLEADRQRHLERISGLEADLAAAQRERQSWLRLLPFLRVRLPGGRVTADRLRAARRRFLRI